jgi:tRNA dimethylallyltransferase
MKSRAIVILGPTASGKTRLAVSLAEKINGEIISADSRQVYQGMDIGTGKDLAEYKSVPFHLINHKSAGDQYDVQQFITDATEAMEQIRQRGAVPIICGGTGLYIHGLLLGMPYSRVPQNQELRQQLEVLSFFDLQEILYQTELPPDFKADISSRKKCIRAIEIGAWFAENASVHVPSDDSSTDLKDFLVFGIDIPQPLRRQRITERLERRIEEGLVQESQRLLDEGLSHTQLQYYGLEYKYCSYLLSGQVSQQEFFRKLNTEIHRFARRQMTFFRKMEKDGIPINWIPFYENGPDLQIRAILDMISES